MHMSFAGFRLKYRGCNYMPERACEIPASNKDGSGGKHVLYCITELIGGENPDTAVHGSPACDNGYINKWNRELTGRLEKMI